MKTVSTGLGQIGDVTLYYPTGVGVVMLGVTNWKVFDNQIFGNFEWGVALISDFTNDDALSQNNEMTDNQMGRSGTDTNGVDFWNDGSGSGNCFHNNTSSTFGVAASTTLPDPEAFLYPDCPAPAGSGTGSISGDQAQVFDDLAPYIGVAPPCNQQAFWSEHSHPDFEGLTPVLIGGTACPPPS